MPYLPHTNPDHDEALVARLAADDLPADEREGRLVRAWVAECPACAELVGDLRTIASATAALPPPQRTRDFRLTEADAARLRPAGWRGWVAQFGSPTMTFTRPLAAGLATLGIAGLLLATLPSGVGGAATSGSGGLAPAGNASEAHDSSGDYAVPTLAPAPAALPAPAASAAASAVPAAASAAPAASAGPAVGASADGRTASSAPPVAPAAGSGGGVGLTTEGGGSKGLSSPANATASPNQAEVAPEQTAGLHDASAGGPSPLVILSLVLLVAGLGLGVLRILGRRIA